MYPAEVSEAIQTIKDYLERLTDEERLFLINNFNVCPYCGTIKDGTCYCTNDD